MIQLNGIPTAPFQERLYDYHKLFAQEVPTLAREGLCEFLQNIDQEEYQVVVLEQNRLTVEGAHLIQRVAKAIGGAFGIAAGYACWELGLLNAIAVGAVAALFG